jgi:ferredoxin-type protein NapH
MKCSVQKRRFLIIILGIIVFLPPIAIIPRFFGSMSLCGSPFCMRMLLQFDRFASMSRTLYVGSIMLIVILLVSFFVGRYWCSHVCPIGGITELGNKIIPNKIRINYKWISAPVVRYTYFAAFLILPIIGVGSLCCNYCNFSIISTLFGSISNSGYRIFLTTFGGIINIVMVVLLGFLAVGGRAYCNFLCPIGAIDSIFNWLGSKIRFFKRLRINEDKCTKCNKCIDDCPVWAIEKKDNGSVKINQISCIPCKICIEKCSEDAISFQKGKKTLE